MAKQVINTNTPNDLINVGTSANSRNGASIRSAFIAVNDAFDKVDANFTELYNTIAAGGVIQVNADWNATTGMAQILNKPFVPDAQVHSDWNAVSGLAQILNKPTIPAAQVQSDWTQADNTSADFIKNKPSIPSIAGLATETYVDTAVSDLVDSSPAALNTLNELAAALNDDVNFSTTVTNLIAAKAELSDLTWSNVTGKPTFATVANTGSYNNLDDKPTIPTVPTNVSAFTNDANYVTSSTINLSAVAQNIVPDGDLTRYLGSPTKRWHSLYVGTGSVYIGDAVLSLTAGKLNSSVGFSTDSLSVGGVDLTVNQAGQIASSAGFAVDNLSIGGVDITINQAGQIESSAGFAVAPADVLPTDAVGFLQNDGTGTLSWATPVSSLDDLSDVDTSSNAPAAGDVLKWDGLKWIPAPDLLAGGAGLDADTLDGQHGSYYLNYTNLTNTPTLFSGSYNDLTNTPSLFSGSYNDLSNKPSLFSGSYNDLTNKPTIPSLTGYATESYVGTAISNLVDTAPTTLDTLNELAAALGDDPNFATTIATAIGNKANTSSLAAVATSGSYTDLTNKPSLFSGSYTDLTSKPTLFDGAYSSLSGKPALFSGSYTDLTNKPNLFSGSYTDLTNKPDFKEILYINDIKDVDTFTVTPTNGMVLKFNGSGWVGGALSYDNLSNKPLINGGTSGYVGTGNNTYFVVGSPDSSSGIHMMNDETGPTYDRSIISKGVFDTFRIGKNSGGVLEVFADGGDIQIKAAGTSGHYASVHGYQVELITSSTSISPNHFLFTYDGKIKLPAGGDIVDSTGTSVLGGGGTGADGASAYEVAVANGFVGSEVAWLASLIGADGADGTNGTNGAKGDTGLTGAKGDKGDTGAKGDPGATGAKGDTGDQGVSVTLQGTKATIGDLPLTGSAGHGWIVTTGDGLTHLDGSLWFWNLTLGQWDDIGPIVGPQGDKGDKGDPGDTGPQGDPGNSNLPADAVGVLTNDGTGNLTWGASGSTFDQTLNTTDSVMFGQVEPGSINQNSSVTVSPNSVNVPGATPTVVFSANSALTSVKLVIAVEGQLDSDGAFVDHTQTCEATIAATYNTNAEPIMSVYGIVYTSPTPLATFTVARNSLSGAIEVTAINSQTTNAMNVRVHAIQFVSRYD